MQEGVRAPAWLVALLAADMLYYDMLYWLLTCFTNIQVGVRAPAWLVALATSALGTQLKST
jgi:hypothetical protein